VCNANKVIARQLDLNEATVKAHVTAILKALKVEIRAQVPCLWRIWSLILKQWRDK
jgi:DNA-binding NarL/FixJ family response regulator